MKSPSLVRCCLVALGLWIFLFLYSQTPFRHRVEHTVRNSKDSRGIPNTCPTPEEIQSDYVKEYYDENRHVGFYYELAFKDISQPRGCKCITSNKTLISTTSLRDDFNVECAGQVCHSDLSFDLDLTKRGTMIGRWNNFSLTKDMTFPNMIVDVGRKKKDDNGGNTIISNPFSQQYDWVIEFQCKDKQILGYKWIEYYGMNFYSKTYEDGDVILQEMLTVAADRGLDRFLQSGFELYKVEHTSKCLQDH